MPTCRNKLLRSLIGLGIFTLLSVNKIYGQLNISASRALVQRIVPQWADRFVIEPLDYISDKDIFEIESKSNKIVLRGTTGIAVASALYYYLNNYCHCQVTWNGTNLHLPKKLPIINNKVHKATPYEYRYYLNYCTFNYSMSWWDWSRWEKEIDWMALHGINMPLAITGEEHTWYQVYKEMGFTDEDLKPFFSGPSYFAWFWMGNLDGYGGPLPLSWMESHYKLQKKILTRERELGMKPVLPAFTGHVPAAFKKKFPTAKLKIANWKNGFGDTYILDSGDSLFSITGKKFLEKQTSLFGTDHLYSADTFNENEPSSDDSTFLSELSAKIFRSMESVDAKATWVMQGWLFYSDRKFWKEKQVKALLSSVPDNRMILLDLAAEIEPVWKRTESFYGKQWIWNMLHNFGGNISLFGRMNAVAEGPAKALQEERNEQMKGIGLTMEGIEQNPVLYELMTANTWTDSEINPDEWLPQYIRNRYGKADRSLTAAWQVLRNTVYNGKLIRDGAESIITGRPTFDSATTWTRTRLNYAPSDILPVWDSFIKAAATYKNSEGFQYDIVDITRQVLANYAMTLHHKIGIAYTSRAINSFNRYANEFLSLITDMDELLATRKDFLLGKWLNEARRWGTNSYESDLYERNARNLITLWGDENSPLHEYSCRQWSGLLNDFYKARWQKLFSEISLDMNEGKPFNPNLFDKNIRNWEAHWVGQHKKFTDRIKGDPCTIAINIYKKYRLLIQ